MAGGKSGCVADLEGIVDLNVQITAVLVVGLDVELALDLLAVLYGEDVLDVEDGLFPVGVLGVRASGEADGLVAGGEVDVEPGDKGMDEVISLGGEGEGSVEGEVGGGASVEVEGEHGNGVSDDRLKIDSIDQRL